jgi:hypothetical protein
MIDDSRVDHLRLFAASFVVLAIGSFWGLPSPGGKSIAGGLVILEGGVPYRDFWTMYAPGQFYVVAGLFWLFGRELLVQAIAVALVRAASAVAFCVLLRRLGATRQISAWLSAVFVLMFWTTGPEFTEYPPALLFLLLALDRVVCYFGRGSTDDLIRAGLWIGLAACFKHDVAAYVAMGTAIGLFVSWSLLGDRRPAAWRIPLRSTCTIAAAALAALAPLALWTAWTAGADAWNDLIVFPAFVFHKIRGEAFPSIIPDVSPLLAWLSEITNERYALSAVQNLSAWLVLTAPRIAFLLGAGALLIARRRLEPASAASLTLFLSCMPFFWAAAHIQQNTHPYTMAILAAGIGVIVSSFAAPMTGGGKTLSRLVILATAVYSAGLLAMPAVRAALVLFEWPGSRTIDLTGFNGVRVPARLGEPFEAVGRFFRTHTREDEPVYIGLLRHDAIVASDPLLYAIAGRPSCCRYTELHPGVADRTSIQQEIIRRLEDTDVRAIALWEFGWSSTVMDARKQRTMAAVPDAGATILDRHIATHFVVVGSYGEYRVLWRRDAPFPDAPPASVLSPAPHAGICGPLLSV